MWMKYAATGIALIALTACAEAPRTPNRVVDDFHQALRQGDSALALSLLAREVVVFESGQSDPARDAYAGAHLPADMNVAAQTEWSLVNRLAGGSGEERWVLSSYHVKGRVDGTPVNRVYLETAILREIGGMYRIVHLHWSSTPDRPG